MRTLLIVFAILLLLLTLLGTFGGSIKYNEPFYQPMQMTERMTGRESKSSYRNIGDPDTEENFYNDAPVPTTMMEMPSMPTMSSGPKNNFYNGVPGTPSNQEARPETSHFAQQIPSEMPIHHSGYTNAPLTHSSFEQEGFSIEPFEAEVHASMPASY